MNELDRTLLDAARAEMGPSDAQRHRLRASVLGAAAATTAAGTATVAASTASAASTATVTAGALALWKGPLIATVIAATMVGGTAMLVTSSPEGAEEPAPRAEELDEGAVVQGDEAPLAEAWAPPAVVGQAAPEPVDLEPDLAPVVEPEPETAEPLAPRRASEPPAGVLAAETALLRDAHAALRAGQPQRALGSLARHAARHPDGFLVEEREATRVIALCAAGREGDARDEAAAFLAAHPRSVHRARVSAACATP